MGALCSLLLLIIMISYAGYKVSILEGKKNIDVVQAVKERHFDDSHVFGSEQGLNVAVAVYNIFESHTHEHIDPSYGRIRFQKTQWSPTVDGDF